MKTNWTKLIHNKNFGLRRPIKGITIYDLNPDSVLLTFAKVIKRQIFRQSSRVAESLTYGDEGGKEGGVRGGGRGWERRWMLPLSSNPKLEKMNKSKKSKKKKKT